MAVGKNKGKYRSKPLILPQKPIPNVHNYHSYAYLVKFYWLLTVFSSLFAGLAKGGKKGTKKKVIDPFTRKDWYDIKAPSMFATRQVGKTLVNRTQGTRIASDGLKGRVFEVSLADLQNDNDAERSFRKFKLIAEDVQGRNLLTNFHGMDLTTDKLR